ncbi:MAG: CBS domain-containing protein [Candidatus Hadarchaeota archaeon]
MKKIVSVKEAMSAKVLVATTTTTVAKAAKLMASRSVGSIVVLKGKTPVGILTERDVLDKVVSEDLKPSKVLVEKVMSSPIMTVTPDTDVTEAAKMMSKNKIRRLPVVEKGKLIGIITSADITAISPDILEAASRPSEPMKEEIEESVCESCGEVTNTLYEVNGMWVCENCRDTSGE